MFYRVLLATLVVLMVGVISQDLIQSTADNSQAEYTYLYAAVSQSTPHPCQAMFR